MDRMSLIADLSGRFPALADVCRSMSAIGCPFTDGIHAMPLLPLDSAAQLQPQHREHNPLQTPLPFNAMVARPVSRKERDSTPAALEAVAKEWRRLRSVKHKDGVGVWDESNVQERSKVAARAAEDGVTVHFA